MTRINFQPAHASDAPRLAEIRVATMRPSLEALGRFDPMRARQRFLTSFDPRDTHLIMAGQEVLGFFVLRHKPDHLWLDHLYVVGASQGMGLGRKVVNTVQRQAGEVALPIRLMALKDSPANAFYTSLGFTFLRQDEFDTLYQWDPSPINARK